MRGLPQRVQTLLEMGASVFKTLILAQKGYNCHMLVDEVDLTLEAGHGGPGKVSFFKKGLGPDGGSGGKGGDINLVGTSDLTALNRFAGKRYFKADDGDMGDSNQKSGRNANDLEISVPVGTQITDVESQETWEITKPAEKLLICEGGIGGMGNFALRSARNTTPEHAQHGLPGKRRDLKLVLRYIADFGLIGLPNAGKSSLLNELTAANVKTADYPFTTLEPNLGVFQRKIIADVPGLIEGASGGKGLGIRFLKHIEKVPVLLHCIAADSLNPLEDYKTIRNELKTYNPLMMKKKEIILLTKTDLVSKEQLEEAALKLKATKKKVFPVSIHDFDALEALKKIIK